MEIFNIFGNYSEPRIAFGRLVCILYILAYPTTELLAATQGKPGRISQGVLTINLRVIASLEPTQLKLENNTTQYASIEDSLNGLCNTNPYAGPSTLSTQDTNNENDRSMNIPACSSNEWIENSNRLIKTLVQKKTQKNNGAVKTLLISPI